MGQDGFSAVSLWVVLDFCSESNGKALLFSSEPGFHVTVINIDKWQILGQLTTSENQTQLSSGEGQIMFK